jgi:hypothetical protein
MNKRTVGFVLVFLGLVMLVVSLAADILRLGNVAGIGWKQILGAVVGAVVALGGVWLVWSKRDLKK